MASSSSTSEGERPPNGGPAPPPQTHAEWAAAMQAYYAAAGHGHPYAAWPTPQMMAATAGAGAAYGAPVPFPMYHPAYYAHASMAAGVPYMAGEATSAVAEGKSKKKIRRAPSGDNTSGSGSGGSGGSSEKRNAGAHQKGSSSAKRRKSSDANAEGEPSQTATAQNAVAEPPSVAKGRSTKLSVSAPGRAALPNATPNLNIWSSSPPTSVLSGQGEVNAGSLSQCSGALSQMDERELKRERRKQSNRESARRSRLRKQQECEELAQKVTDLTAINGALKSELDQLKKECEDMEAENTQLMDEMLTHDDKMRQPEHPNVLTALSIQIDTSKAHEGTNGKLDKNTDSDSKGSSWNYNHEQRNTR